MNYNEARRQANSISSLIRGRVFKDKVTGTEIMVSKVTPKTKYEGVRDEYEVYVEGVVEKIEDGWYSYSEIKHSFFWERFLEQS